MIGHRRSTMGQNTKKAIELLITTENYWAENFRMQKVSITQWKPKCYRHHQRVERWKVDTTSRLTKLSPTTKNHQQSTEPRDSTLPRKHQMTVLIVSIEVIPPSNPPTYLHCLLVAQESSRNDGVPDMVIYRVVRIQHRRDTPLHDNKEDLVL